MPYPFFRVLFLTTLLWLGACQLPADSTIQEPVIAFGFSEEATSKDCGIIAVFADGSYTGEGSCIHGEPSQGKIGEKEIEQIQTLLNQYQDLEIKEVNHKSISWISFYGSGNQNLPEEKEAEVIALCQSIMDFTTRKDIGIGGSNVVVSSYIPADPRIYQPLSGVIVAVSNEVHGISPAGSFSILSDILSLQLLPRKEIRLYIENNDIWLIDADKFDSNLTNSANIIESKPDRQLLNGSKLVFLSRPNGQPESENKLTIIDLDGRNYTILENAPYVKEFRVSPNGSQIAYSTREQAGILQVEGNQVVNQFSLQATMAEMGITQIGDPIWAPNGQRIAWLVETQQADENGWAYAFHDVQQGRVWLSHPFNLISTDNLPANGRWSPDSAWFAVSIVDTDMQKTGVWLLPWDAQETKIYTGKTINPIWSPQGALVVQALEEPEWWVFTNVRGTYQVVPVFPSGSYILDWFDNPIP